MESHGRAEVRDRSIDTARGIAIIAIVLGHVERGLSASFLLPYDTALALDRLLYLVHLATFAYLSGLFVRRAVERDGVRRMLTRRVTLFVWLYLLWTLIQGSVRVAASSVGNFPVTMGSIARIWVPEGQLWFLPWLIGATVVAVVAQPWRSRRRGAVILVLAGALALAVWGHDPLYAFTRGWALLLPLLLGCAVGAGAHAAASRRLPLVTGGALVGTAGWLWAGLATSAVTTPTTGGEVRTVSTVAWGVLGCAAGTFAVLALAALVARTPLGHPLAFVGRRSLEIFLAHIIFAAGTRIALVQVGETDPWVHVLAGTVLGVLGPLALAQLMERLGWSWLFGLPRRMRPARLGERRSSTG